MLDGYRQEIIALLRLCFAVPPCCRLAAVGCGAGAGVGEGVGDCNDAVGVEEHADDDSCCDDEWDVNESR